MFTVRDDLTISSEEISNAMSNTFIELIWRKILSFEMSVKCVATKKPIYQNWKIDTWYIFTA